MKRKYQIVSASVSFLAGIVLAANFVFTHHQYIFLLAALMFASSLAILKSKLGYIALVCVGLTLGIFWHNMYEQNKLPSILTYENQKTTVIGTVQGEPRWDEYRNYVFYISEPSVQSIQYRGLVRVKTLAGVVREGQKVVVTGKVKYSQGKAESLISYADVKIVNANQPIMVQIKELFLKGINASFSELTAAFMAGILIGSRSGLPADVTNVFTILGLSHIVAVSGYNLTILVGVLQRRFSKNWRWGGLVSSLWIILGFVIISGASASIVRAGIMSSVFLLVNYYGRKLDLLTCMALCAVGMVMVSPDAILSDIGWQLSFLSLLGIGLFTPKISSLLPTKPRIINDVISVTLAAQLATAGLVAYKFGVISVIAPLSNLLVVPIIPLLMLVGFVAAILGILVPAHSYNIFGVYIDQLFTLMLDLLKYLASWSNAQLQVGQLSLRAVCVYYICIIALFTFIRGKNQPSSILEKYVKLNSRTRHQTQTIKM